MFQSSLFKRTLFIIIGLGTFAVLFWYVNNNLYRFFAGNPVITGSLIPSERTIDISTVGPKAFKLGVSFSGQQVGAIELYLDYDSELVEYHREFRPNESGFEDMIYNNQGYFGPPLIETITDKGNGKKQLKLLLTSPGRQISSSILIALKFRAKKGGTANFVVQPETQVVGVQVVNGVNEATAFDLSPQPLTAQVQIIQNLPTATPTTSVRCALHPEGDANCDNAINNFDFVCWRFEYIDKVRDTDNCERGADFNSVGGVDLIDYVIWKLNNYLN